MNGIDLKKLVPSEVDLSNRTTWVMFKEGIRFKIRYVSRATLTHLAESNMVASYDPKQRGRVKTIDPTGFIKAFAKTVVQDWAGMTLRALSGIIPIDIPEGKENEELPFTDDNLFFLLQNAHELETYLHDSATDAALFRSVSQEAISKNFESSQSGTSIPITLPANNVSSSTNEKAQ